MRNEPKQNAQAVEPSAARAAEPLDFAPFDDAQDRRDERVRASKNRLLQRTRPSNRKLFDARAKRRFLDVFAATANARMGAEAAGVAYQTVFKHRARDAEFACAWEDALAQGYARLEAEVLAAALSPSDFADETVRDAVADDAGAPAPYPPAMTVEQKLMILREYRRGFGAGRRAPSARPVVASQEEAIAALAKRLANFAVRGRLALPAPRGEVGGPSTSSGQGASDGDEGAGSAGE